MHIFWEVFGYLGTALIVVSMMMTSVQKLRILNASGSLISLIYAIVCRTWPVAVLNICMILINVFHILRHYRQKKQGR